MKKEIGRAAVAVAMGSLLGCGGGGTTAATQTITMAAVVDSSGSAGDGNWASSVTLAADQVNAGLVASGSPIRFQFLVSDSTNTPTVAVPRAVDLVRTSGAKALVTDTSQDTLETLKLQYDADPSKHLDVPIVGLVATSPSYGNPLVVNPDPLTQDAFRDAGDWGFRTSMSTVTHGKVIAELARTQANGGDANSDGKIKIAIFASNEPFGLGYTSVVKAGVAAVMPTAIVETVLFPATSDPNDLSFFAAEYAKLVDGHNEETGTDDGVPDILVSLTFPSFSAAIVKAYVQGGAAVPLVHGMGMRAAKVLASLGSDANGQTGVSPILVEQNASGESFSRDIKAATGLLPAQMDSASYDAAISLMLAALIAAEGQPDATAITGAQIRDALRRTSDQTGEMVRAGAAGMARAVTLIRGGQALNYEGASGPCDYDQEGNVTTRIARFGVESGKFTDAKVFDCVMDSSCPAL